MEKLINYIKRGKGIGLKYLLLFALFYAIVLTVALKRSGDEVLVPAAQKIADEFLPIKIENGVIVEPENMYKTYTLQIADDESGIGETYEIIMNTEVETINPADMKKEGAYITKNAIYFSTNNQLKVYPFEDSAYFPVGDYRDAFTSVLNWTLFILLVFFFIGLAIVYELGVVFYALLSYIISALFKKKFDFDLRMRMSTLAFIATGLVFTFLNWFGYGNRIVFMFAVLALEAVFIKEIAAEEEKQAEDKA